jgi:putative transposase
MITRAYKFRLYPTYEQRVRFWGSAELARRAWNWTIALCEREYESALIEAGVLDLADLEVCKKRKQRIAVVAKARQRAKERGVKIARPSINRGRLYKAWCEMRDTTQNSIGTYYSQVPSYPIERVVKAYKDWWSGRARMGAPKFHRENHPSSFMVQLQRRSWSDGAIKIPGVGEVATVRRDRGRWCGENPATIIPPGKPCSITVTRKANEWWASIAMKDVDQSFERGIGVVGVDLGMAATITTSDDVAYPPPRPLEKALRRLAILQRRRQRKPKRSRRRTLLDIQIARLHARAANIRADHLHVVSTELVRRYETVVVEGFDIVDLVSEAVEWRATRRGMMDIAWGEMRRQLEYKLAWRGGELSVCPRFHPTNQQCASCWRDEVYSVNECPPSQAIYRCSTCGTNIPRRRNTALLLEIFGRGGLPENNTGAQPGSSGPCGSGGHARGGADSTVRGAAPVKREHPCSRPSPGASSGAGAFLAGGAPKNTQDGVSDTSTPACQKNKSKKAVKPRKRRDVPGVPAEVSEHG